MLPRLAAYTVNFFLLFIHLFDVVVHGDIFRYEVDFVAHELHYLFSVILVSEQPLLEVTSEVLVPGQVSLLILFSLFFQHLKNSFRDDAIELLDEGGILFFLYRDI